jgi:two-component sensor histidine kinase/tetratricopeptide (TPR) repeat protein
MRNFSAVCCLLLPLWTALAQPAVTNRADSLREALRLTSPDTSRVHLLLALGDVYVARKEERADDLNSALLLCRQADALSRSLHYPRGQGMSYLLTARVYRKKKDVERGKFYTRQAIEWLTRHGSLHDQAEAYIEQATYYVVSEAGLRDAIQLNEKIVSLLRRSGDTLLLADELVHRGDLYQMQSKNAESLRLLGQALALYQALGHTQLQHVYDRLGFVAGKTGDYEAAVEYGLLAVRTAETAGDSARLGDIYNYLGYTYTQLNQPEKALHYYQKSLGVARKQDHRYTIILLANTISAIIDVYTGTGQAFSGKEATGMHEAVAHLQKVIDRRPADMEDVDCQVAVGRCMVGFYGRLQRRYDRAQPYCKQLEDLLNANLGNDYKVFIHGFLIPFYLVSGKHRQAQVLLAKNERICRATANTKQLSINHLWWFQLDSARGSYPSAIRHYQQYKALNDSLITERTREKTSLLEVQYETREKEHKIVALRQQSQLRENDLQRAHITRNYIIAGAVMLALLLGVIYNRYRLKRRSNELLEARQQKLLAQHEELQAQQEELQAQQKEIHQKNADLSQLLGEKDVLLRQQDRLLEEKERLLKEIHHRVKNNLQVVISLLNSQAASLEDQAALSAIQESQHRVQAMALIHQKLYQAEGVARIPMAAYIEEVVAYLSDSYNLSQPIAFHLSVDEIELDVAQAVPLGLIINEVITNAFKYAFPGGRAGMVSLSLHRRAEAACELTIADDGVGLPANYDPSRSRSLGMTLLHGFSGQLGGELTIASPPGLRIGLLFDEEPLGLDHAAAQYA